MSENPFHCSCDLQWIVNPAYQDRLPIIEDLDQAECLVNYYGNHTSKAPIMSVPSNQFLCEYQSHCFSLCMCCDFLGCDCRMQCPEGCSCYHDATWSSNIIQCSARAHKTVPPLIPMDATSVFLDGNMMTNLTGQIFLGRSRMRNLYLNNSQVMEVSNNTFVGLQDLQLLDLSDNLISMLSGSEFTDLVNLRELYLQNNKIAHIAQETFRPLKSLSVLRIDNNLLTNFPIWELSTNPFLIGMYIANNVWTCECEFVSNFRMFIDGNLDKVMDSQDVQCIVNNLMDEVYSKSGRNCIESTNAAYRTEGSTDFGAMGIIIGCCIMFLAIIFLMFAMYKMQDTMLLWIHAKYGIRIPTKNCMVGNNDKLFDAYFSYCLKDDQVVSQIARELHDYRLCLHQQNLLGNNRNQAEAALSAAKASARTVIVISKAFLAQEWDQGIKTFLLGPESGDISRNVIIILLEDMFEYDSIQNFEVKTFINSCANILRWRECKFWAKLKYLLPDPISSTLDKTNITQLDTTEVWNLTPKAKTKMLPDSGVSSARMSQVSLCQTQAQGNVSGTNTMRSDSMRFKTKSRQSLPSSVGSNNEFIYLTPKPKKAHCQPMSHEDITHQRSSSEIYQQQSQYTGGTYHQRSKSSNASNTANMYPYYEGQTLEESMIPLHPSNSNTYNQIDGGDPSARQIYGSTSFIYKLISSTGVNETPTLPMSSGQSGHSQYNVHNYPPHHPLQQPQLPSRSQPNQIQATIQPHTRAQSYNMPHQPYVRSQTHLVSVTGPDHPQQRRYQPHHEYNSTLNILQDALQHSPSSSSIHQRSKSTPYNGFVV